MMSCDAHQKSKQFGTLYKKYADLIGLEFIDASLYAKPSALDELHIDAEGHLSLANAMAKKVLEII